MQLLVRSPRHEEYDHDVNVPATARRRLRLIHQIVSAQPITIVATMTATTAATAMYPGLGRAWSVTGGRGVLVLLLASELVG